MNIQRIQNKILDFLPKDYRDQPGTLLENSCSEVSRLVADWIKNDLGSYKINILKGDNVYGTDKSHDILEIKMGDEIVVLDPTIWQFFPEADSILVSLSDSEDKSLEQIQEKYGGKWSVSEKFTGLGKAEREEYLRIIAQNINEVVGNCKTGKLTGT